VLAEVRQRANGTGKTRMPFSCNSNSDLAAIVEIGRLVKRFYLTGRPVTRGLLARRRNPHGRRPFQCGTVLVERRPVDGLVACAAGPGGVPAAVAEAGLMPALRWRQHLHRAGHHFPCRRQRFSSAPYVRGNIPASFDSLLVGISGVAQAHLARKVRRRNPAATQCWDDHFRHVIVDLHEFGPTCTAVVASTSPRRSSRPSAMTKPGSTGCIVMS